MTHEPGTPWTVADIVELTALIDSLRGKPVWINGCRLPPHDAEGTDTT